MAKEKALTLKQCVTPTPKTIKKRIGLDNKPPTTYSLHAREARPPKNEKGFFC